ncbi:hypothetical protein EHS13_26260 [Paenibacillus psychroresistens]|uniref:Uncharacterized protein n=1 Tax=Paenibacillus psychroresistens TaxID=1778678 RepID=A0A6B8RP55_9BACL|nr:hypothetical protein [Paenibacillus psychroresistens]QGQ98141.1 hypothetical protein EHS13_26260 [Paenibacillus psychroresistens]
MQKNGPAYYAAKAECQLSESCAELLLNIEDAYPSEAGVVFWQRTCRLNRGADASIQIIDDYVLDSEASASVSFSLMTLCEPLNIAPGMFELEYAMGKRVTVSYDSEQLLINFERIELTESRLRKNWGDTVYRVLLTTIRSEQIGTRKLLIKQSFIEEMSG